MAVASDALYESGQLKSHAMRAPLRRRRELDAESEVRESTPEPMLHHGEIVGGSHALLEALKRLEAVAVTPATTLIHGESGVGKELFARAIHRLSTRRQQRLVKVNCASIPRELFESEFFGHVRGSFTGAHRDRVGRFKLADGGTLFLDEVAEIPVSLQAKLLRVLQEGQFERIGDEKTITVDVRIVAATNRDLKQAVQDGEFREDLYYRLCVFPIPVPPLRERLADVLPLARHFLAAACDAFEWNAPQLSNRDVSALMDYEWPGNIRELRNLVERALILSGDGEFDLTAAMPAASDHRSLKNLMPGSGANGVIKEADWQHSYRENIVAALEASHWRISGDRGAASLLGINASTLRGRMKSLNIPMPRDTR